jgi:hypothetical protein
MVAQSDKPSDSDQQGHLPSPRRRSSFLCPGLFTPGYKYQTPGIAQLPPSGTWRWMQLHLPGT